MRSLVHITHWFGCLYPRKFLTVPTDFNERIFVHGRGVVEAKVELTQLLPSTLSTEAVIPQTNLVMIIVYEQAKHHP